MFNKLGIKSKLLIVLVGAVALALAIAGILQYFYLYSSHKKNAFEKITISQSIIQNDIEILNLQSQNIIKDVLSDNKIGSTLSIVSKYQDSVSYQPLIFDQMKQDLLEHIVNKFIFFDNICFTLFDANGDIVAFLINNNMSGLKQGIGSYENSIFKLINPYTKELISISINQYSLSSDFTQIKDKLLEYYIFTKEESGTKALCLSKGTEIKVGDEIVGYIKVSRHIDNNFVDELSKKTSTYVDFIYNEFDFGAVVFDSPENKSLLVDELIDTGNLFVKITSYWFDNNEVLLVNAVSKDIFNEEIYNSFRILILSIFIAIFIVLPIMIYVLQKDILRPIVSLLGVTKEIKKNNYDVNIDIQTPDITLNDFLGSFKSMVNAIKQRDREIKVRNFYDKLIAASSAKFLNSKSFDEQIKDSLRLIKLSLKAQRVVVETFIEESQVIKKDYKVGLECPYKNLCEDCLCLETIIQSKTKDVLFVKDVSQDKMFEDCRIFKEQQIKSMIVMPITIKDRRVAVLIIEFTSIKNEVDDNYSYLLKPLAGIFSNVLAQELQDEKNINKEQMLFQQSKMAAMGEMIGNIAHQWRQPLSAITTSSSGMKLKEEYGLLTKEDIIDFNESILTNANYLSKTIDDFRNFFKNSKDIELFNGEKLIEKSLKLVESSYKHHFINIDLKVLKDDSISGYFSEAIQAILNILNNAKDAMVSNGSHIKVVQITIDCDNDFVIISIKDSGGGISDDIKTKIFDPYFTTKHQSQGTGIGLYMSNEIITKHLNGKIDVHNITFKYKTNECSGADFRIYLPIYKG